MKVIQLARIILGSLAIAYLSACGYLFIRQQQAIYYPTKVLDATPASPDFAIPYETVQFTVEFPNEQRIYQDAQAAWNYLTQTRQIQPQDIVLYGESMGGAVAIDLATKQPQAQAVIVQSSFTSMAAVIRRRQEWYSYFPIELLLTEKFDSLSKVKTLKMPILFIHGTDYQLVPVDMSQTLNAQAPDSKQLSLVPNGAHVRIYNPQHSYLKAIQRFLLEPLSP
jgi:fermentation-respiration switch protein FrsA (DUF1100 family)